MFLSFIISVSAVWRCRIHRHKVHRVVCATLARDLWCTTRTKTGGDVAVETPSASLQYTSPFLYSFFVAWLCLSLLRIISIPEISWQVKLNQNSAFYFFTYYVLFAGQCGGFVSSFLVAFCKSLIFWMFLGVYVFCTYHSVRLSTEIVRILCSTVFHQKLASANRWSVHVFYLAGLRHLSFARMPIYTGCSFFKP